MIRISSVTATLLLVAVLLGCSSGNQPVAPTPDLSGSGQINSASGDQQLWGFWNVSLDPGTGEFDCVPLRAAMFQANVTQFLQPPMSPTNLLSLTIDSGASDLANGLLVCSVTLRHPFPSLPQYRGFDVKGICMGDATHAGLAGDGEYWPEPGELKVLNADGYTRWWNPTEFTKYNSLFGYTPGKLAPAGFFATGTVNGYKYFADGLAEADPLTSLDLDSHGTYGVNPGINSRRYEIQFPMAGSTPSFKFNYAVTASYFEPDSSGLPNYPIDSFPASANSAEAFFINVIDTGSSAYYENPGSLGGNLKLELEVFDWGLADALAVTDEIAGIILESATLFSGQIDIDLDTAVPGGSDYSRIFPVTIMGVTPTGTENQDIMVRVLCAHPTSYAPDLQGISGFPYPEQAPLTSYVFYTAPISNSLNNTPPEVGVIDGPSGVFENQDADYTLSFATDAQDGTNLTILWDSDGDLDFADDLDGVSTDLNATLSWSTIGDYQIIARAVDSGGLHTDSAPFDVTVTYCPTSIHDTFTSVILGDISSPAALRLGVSFQTAGTYAGEYLAPGSATEIRRFDTTQTGTWPSSAYINLQGADASAIIASLDVDDFSGRVIVAGRCNSWPANQFQAYDSNGSYLTTISIQ